MTEQFTIGIDLGGTKLAAAVVDGCGAVLEDLRMPSPAGSWEQLLEAIVESVDTLRAAHPAVAAVGIGAAGMVGLDGVIHYSPNVLGFRNTPMQSAVADRVGLPVAVDNDANVAALGEARFGAARGWTDAMVITLGTGIGGGIIANGRLLRGAHGFAAEVGHFQIDPQGPVCACGEVGHWEALASGTALGLQARAAAAVGGAPSVLARAGGDLAAIRGQHVSAAARNGAPDALALVDRYSAHVAVGLVALANIFDPGVIAIAGGIVNDGDLFLGPIRRHFVGHIEGAQLRPMPEVIAAALGERAGVVGAATLARDAVLAS